MVVTRLSKNPVRAIRENEGQTIKKFAEACGVHHQTIYYLECGCYPMVLPKVFGHCVIDLGYNGNDLLKAYEMFQLDIRKKFSDRYDLPHLKLPKEVPLEAPLATLWRSWDIGYSGLSKGLCVQPSLLYAHEKGQYVTIPQPVLAAFRQASLSQENITELNRRTRVFYDAIHLN